MSPPVGLYGVLAVQPVLDVEGFQRAAERVQEYQDELLKDGVKLLGNDQAETKAGLDGFRKPLPDKNLAKSGQGQAIRCLEKNCLWMFLFASVAAGI